MKKPVLSFVFLFVCFWLMGQNPNKKTMDHDVFNIWNTISSPQISNDGNWVVYELTNEGRDPQLHLYHAPSQSTKKFSRGTKAKISADNQWLVFKIVQPQDSLKAMRRRKVKKNKLPKDSLGIYELSTGQFTQIANVQSFVLPQKWSGWLAYHQTEIPPVAKDSTQTKEKGEAKKKNKKLKKANKKNGTLLVIRHLPDGKEQQFDYVKKYLAAEEGPHFAFSTTGKDSTWLAGIYIFNCNDQKHQAVFQQKGKYKQLNFDKKGKQLSFVADIDTTKNSIRPYGLYYWKAGNKSARLVQEKVARQDGEDYWVSEHFKPYFAENGDKLYFGSAPHPIQKDTTLLPEEVAQVEVWSYTDQQLHTQQKVLLDRDKKRSFLSVWDSKKKLLKYLSLCMLCAL